MKKLWRKDFHNYVLRKKNGLSSAVREDQMKLKINGSGFATCSYTKGAGFTSNE